MLGMKMSDAKSMFFDREYVRGAVDRTTHLVLSKFGAYVRRTAKGLIRKRRRASDPGRAPSSHTGLLKDYIYFAYEPSRETVVIGPVLLGGKSQRSVDNVGTVPETLEYGGDAVVKKTGRPGRRIHISARPYMQPAFDKEEKQLPQMWADAVK